jgi:exoribonuclease R
MKYFEEYINSDTINVTLEVTEENIDSIINNRAIIGDIVYLNNRNEVTNVKERTANIIVGILYLDSKTKYGILDDRPLYLFKPSNKSYPNFYVPYNKKNNKKIYATIQFKKWDITDKFPIGILSDIIGELGNKENEYEHLRIYYQVYNKVWKIDNEKIKQDKNIIENINNQIEDYKIFSIDPVGSKDIDDAFHYNETSEYYEVGIHIASPTIFFEKDINTIFNRVSTIYLPDRKYNMLPNIYSDNLVSLIENVNRYALSFIFKFDNNNNNIINFEIKETIVKNIKNFTYEEFNNSKHNFWKFVDFSKKYFNDESLNDSHILVEKWMIFTNQKVANYLIQKNESLILRKHIDSNNNIDTHIFDKDAQKIAQYLKYKSESSALYDIYDSSGDIIQTHSKLNKEYYTHVTSPIRRAVDFYIHLLLRNIVSEYSNNQFFPLIEKEVINKINLFNKNSKRFYRSVKRMEYIFSINKEEKIAEYGYIIKIGKQKLTIYIPNLNLEEKIVIIPSKFEKIAEIISFDDTHIEYSIDNEIKKYNLYEKVNIELYVFIKNENIFDKLRVEICDNK